MKTKPITRLALFSLAASIDCVIGQEPVKTIPIERAPGAICQSGQLDSQGRTHFYLPDAVTHQCQPFDAKSKIVGNRHPQVFTLVPEPGIPWRPCLIVFKGHAERRNTTHKLPCVDQPAVTMAKSEMRRFYNGR